MSVWFAESESDLASLRRQLAEARENLRLIQERKSEFVMGTDIPLQLVKEERQLLERIEELEQRVERLERDRDGLLPGQEHAAQSADLEQPVERLERAAQQTVGSATSLGLGTRPPGPARDRWRNPKDGKEMVRVPAGKFLYGDDKSEVELPEFWIDKAPVTEAEYARFVAEMGHEPPSHWKGKSPPKQIADHPVTWVSWYDAVAYAKWVGGRLPTEQEWEKAARGMDGREYPWGEWAEGDCNSEDRSIGDTTPVGKYSPQGDSPYGCVDMAFNVWEWTTSSGSLGTSGVWCAGGRGAWVGGSAAARAASGPPQTRSSALRGCGWRFPVRQDKPARCSR